MFLRRKFFSQLVGYRFFALFLTLLLPMQPLMGAVSLTKDQQRQYIRFVENLLSQSQGNQAKDSLAATAMGTLPCIQDQTLILGSNEWQELQLDALIKAIDKTKTSFGRNVLRQSVQPTTDLKLITMRRNQVEALLNDSALCSSIGKELERLKKAEEAILAYWDESQFENQGALFHRAKDFYKLEAIPSVRAQANSSSWSLEALATWKLGRNVLMLLALLGLNGFLQEFNRWSSDSRRGRTFDVKEAILTGLKTPLLCMYPYQTRISKNYDGDKWQWLHAIWAGSLGDAQHVVSKGFTDTAHVKLGRVGRFAKMVAHYTPRLIPRCPQGDCCRIGETINSIAPAANFANRFDDAGAYAALSAADLDAGHSLSSWAAALIVSGIKFSYVWPQLTTSWKQIKQHVSTMKELHVHTIHTARAVDAMQKLAGMICDHEQLRTSCTAAHMHEVIGHPSAHVQKLFHLLKEGTFTLAKAQSYIYSRGNVLLAHSAFKKVKNELVPLLQAVGEIDAAYSMACTIKEHQKNDRPFSFVEFVPGEQATIHFEHAWLPMVKDPIANTMSFGGGAHPNKVVITGPNGGGKSVFLKLLGSLVALAQSWGIVPAQRARLSLFNGVRSCIHPQESIEHELSTFMAEKMRIDAIKQYVFQNNTPGFKALLLLDEPFKGTVDAESADRIYAFGKDIASLNGLIVTIATHVEKPINLAQDTGAYKNYHVAIKELPDGTFERQFTIEPGVVRWWFDDPNKRSRFIDFVTLEKHKEEQKQASV